jgi:hypothetical protein
MPLPNQPNINRLRDYASLFSRQVASEVLSGNLDKINKKVERYDPVWGSSNKTYYAYLRKVYHCLHENYRNEYILKNELLNDWLRDHIGSSDSEIYSEFKVGTAKADLVMFNGSARAFEIKSEYDSPARLNNQLSNYTKAFHEVYVVVPEVHLKKYTSGVDDSVGLISFRDGGFKKERESKIRKRLCRKTVMTLLHCKEYKQLVEDYYGSLPPMTSFTQYDVCFERIMDIDENRFTALYLSFLKNRTSRPKLSTRYHAEFNQLILAMNWNEKQMRTYFDHLKMPIA